MMPAAQGSSLGFAVACEGLIVGQMFAGGQTGVRKDVGGTWVGALTNLPTFSLSRPTDQSLPLLVGRGGLVEFYDSITGAKTGQVSGGANFGLVVQWFPTQPSFVVLSSSGEVSIYDFNIGTRTATARPAIVNMTSGFGQSLAVGDFLSPPGEELAIGADGVVFIYDQSGTQLALLSGSEPSFGASLAVERGYVPGLDALFVGEPSRNTVHRFIGRWGSVASELFNATGARFGASLAVDPDVTQLAVGAPGYQFSGAVFFERLGPNMRMGEARACVAGNACVTSNCTVGTCIGDVFCDTTAGTFLCGPLETCNGQGLCVQDDGGVPVFDGGVTILDAGLPRFDAGTAVDAGVEMDGGMPMSDAGLFDAGEPTPDMDGGPSADAGTTFFDAGNPSDAGSKPDAGREERKDAGLDAGDDGTRLDPLIFSTSGCSGCSETGPLPLLLLALGWASRRGRARDSRRP